jgi:hypothetical protein
MEKYTNVLRSKVRTFLTWVLVVQIFSYCTVLYYDTKNKINHMLGKKSNYSCYKQIFRFSSSPYLPYTIGLSAEFITKVDKSFVLMY